MLFVTDPNNDDTAVDFVDVGSGTYYIKIENKSPVTATVTGIANNDKLESYENNKTIASGSNIYFKLINITEKSETEFSTDALFKEFTLGGVYDFTVTYTLEHVHTSDNTADATFTQPAYIGAWKTNDDPRELPYNNVTNRVNEKGDDNINPSTGQPYSNPGLSVYRQFGSHTIDLSLNFQVDKGIFNQTWKDGIGSTDNAFIHSQLFVDSTDIPDYTVKETGETGKRWQDIGLRMRAQSWATHAVHLNPTNQSNTEAGELELSGNYDTNSVFSFYMENVQNHNSDWSGSKDLTTWTVNSRKASSSNDGYVAGTDNLKTQRGWTKGSAEGTINNGISYFPITGLMFKGSNTGIEPAIAYFGADGKTYRLVHTEGGDKGAAFRFQIDFYIFDKTELRELVRNTIPAQLSEHYNTTTWGEYKTNLEEAYKALAAQKTTQSAIYDAYTALNDSYTNLKSTGVQNKIVKITHNLYTGTQEKGPNNTYTEYVLVPVNESYTPNHSEYASASNKNNATEHQYTDGNGVEEISVEYWTESTLTIDLNGGLTTDSYQETETKWLSDTTTLPTVTRDGFTFNGWAITEDGGTLDENGTVYTFNENDTTLTAKWLLKEDSLKADTYVVNFGLPLKISPLNNDTVNTIETSDNESKAIVGIAKETSDKSLDPSENNKVGKSKTVEGQGGKFTLSDDNTITYTQDKNSVAGGTDKIVYAVEYKFAKGQTTYAYDEITVVPAVNVYYEDNVGLITYKDGEIPQGVDGVKNTGKWQETNGGNSLPKIDIDNNNTGEEEYNKSAGYSYSMGSAHYVDVSASNNPNPAYCKGTEGNVGSWPYARFTFSGTGFEVISLLSNTTGTVEVKVYQGADTDEKGQPSGTLESSMLIDSYYGYTYDSGTWTAAGDSNNTLYQIPLIKKTGLTYGTYTVIITPKFSTIFDHENAGSYNFYLDAIRIYDPISTENEAVYYTDTEKSLFHGSLRPLIINSEIADTDKDTLLGGAWFIDGMSEGGKWEDFVKYGPKNEVYLDKGQAITFQLKSTDINSDNIPKIKVSMHALDDKGANVTIGRAATESDSAEAREAFNVNTATTLYYEIPNGYITWNNNDKITNAIIIQNNGEGRLSLCDIEVFAKNGSAAQKGDISLVVTKSTIVAATNTVSLMSTHDMSKGFFIADSISAAPAYSKILRNADSEINVKTSEDVAKVTVNGEEIELAETADGVKSWDYDFTAGKTSGTETFEVVAYSSAGNPTDPLEVTVDVQSRFEQIFDRLHDVIEMIINIFISMKTE